MKSRYAWFSSLSIILILLCAPPGFMPQGSNSIAQSSSQQQGAQGQDEVVRVNTRVVFIDVLVRDKGLPVRDLGRENFRVLDDGRQRDITYFSGDHKRRPLALMLVIDAWPSHEGWLAKRGDIMDRFASSLWRLPPEDEVGVMLTMFGEPESPCEPTRLGQDQVVPLQMLQGLTRDRDRVAAALNAVPRLARRLYETRDGVYSTKRRMNFKPSGLLCLPDALSRLADERPTSQVTSLVVTDDINIFSTTEEEAITERLVRSAVPVHAFVTRLSLFAIGSVTVDVGTHMEPGKPVNRRAYVVQSVAKDTGGDVVQVRDPKEYPAAFDIFVDGLASRYSLGFKLGEGAADDGRLHKLEVTVNARDARGKERRLVVSARRSYYLPKSK